MSENEKLLEVKNLRTSFFTHVGEVKAVRDVSFHLDKGEILGIVGESGSGKSVTCMSVMRLLQDPGRIIGGEILYEGEDLVKKSEKEMRRIRGEKISMVFQDPMTAMNPVFTVGNQMIEVIRQHRNVNKKEAHDIAVKMLGLVGIPSPEERMKNYPHEFSGGMRQRAMIAMALSCGPDLLIADEPTTALDVTIQAQVLDLMKDLQQKTGTAIILITHDLGVIAETCRRVLVMYGGMLLESGTVEEIFHHPGNPYTLGLLRSVPNPEKSRDRLEPIPGSPPDLIRPPEGCPFCYRCKYAMNKCVKEIPPLFDLSETHQSRCWLLHPDAPATDAFEKEGK
ncbi:MAG: ABC transporter ATP-binding protein [Oscillospiraceae bacterium]|nr:ABC transporter ATP-binding protein [Oscillospiraceae bacterium]